MNGLKNISASAGIAILIAFFLPWITVSCGGTEVTHTGSDIVQDASEENDNQENVLLVIIPIIGLAALGIAGLLHDRSMSVSAADTILVILSGIGLLLHALLWIAVQGQFDDPSYSVTYEHGWWISIVGLIALGLGGLFAGGDEVAESLPLSKPEETFLEYTPRKGETIYDAAVKMVRYAKEFDEPVTATLNNVEVTANPGDTPESVVVEYFSRVEDIAS